MQDKRIHWQFFSILLIIFIGILGCSSNKQLSDNEAVIVEREEVYVPPQLLKTGACANPVTAITFSKAIVALQNEKTNSKRFDLAGKFLENYCLYSHQVVAVLNLFALEEDQLKLAKKAYSSTYDPTNYFIVTRLFKLESSKASIKALIVPED